MSMTATIPVTVLTGFLGSGKTTVLNRLLKHPGLADTAVIINELGELGLDHLLVERTSENLTLLNNGCVCCTVRGDLVETLGELEARRRRGDISSFTRAVVETTGLADPAPILHTLMADPAVTCRYRLEGVITTVDAVNGAQTLDAHAEATKQAAVADRILLTKGDLAGGERLAALRRRLETINDGTPMLEVVDGRVDPSEIFTVGFFDPAGKTADVRRWLHAEAHDHAHLAADGHHEHYHRHRSDLHDDRVRTHCFTIADPVRWEDFSVWLELMAAMRGANMLRVKGIVAIAEDPERPMVVHGVQHVFHPPVRLDRWPSADRRSRLVFITRDLPRAVIERTLQKFGGVDRERMAAG